MYYVCLLFLVTCVPVVLVLSLFWGGRGSGPARRAGAEPSAGGASGVARYCCLYTVCLCVLLVQIYAMLIVTFTTC